MAGVRSADIDPATGEQWEVVAVDRHPEGPSGRHRHRHPRTPVTPHLPECKTHNQSPLAAEAPWRRRRQAGHVAQMQVYHAWPAYPAPLHLAKHKDSDRLYAGASTMMRRPRCKLMAKAERIRRTPPATHQRRSEFFQCRWCRFPRRLPRRPASAAQLPDVPACIAGTLRDVALRPLWPHALDKLISAPAAPIIFTCRGLVGGEQIDADEVEGGRSPTACRTDRRGLMERRDDIPIADLIGASASHSSRAGSMAVSTCARIFSAPARRDRIFAARRLLRHVPRYRASASRFASLEWGRVVMERIGKPVLMLAPLAVGPQHEREARRFGIDARYVRTGDEIDGTRIYITNYERLDNFVVSKFGGIILDESSILKSFSGVTTKS